MPKHQLGECLLFREKPICSPNFSLVRPSLISFFFPFFFLFFLSFFLSSFFFLFFFFFFPFRLFPPFSSMNVRRRGKWRHRVFIYITAFHPLWALKGTSSVFLLACSGAEGKYVRVRLWVCVCVYVRVRMCVIILW